MCIRDRCRAARRASIDSQQKDHRMRRLAIILAILASVTPRSRAARRRGGMTGGPAPESSTRGVDPATPSDRDFSESRSDPRRRRPRADPPLVDRAGAPPIWCARLPVEAAGHVRAPGHTATGPWRHTHRYACSPAPSGGCGTQYRRRRPRLLVLNRKRKVRGETGTMHVRSGGEVSADVQIT